MVGAPEFKMLQMPNQHGLISDRPGCRPPLKLGILKGDKYVGSLPSTNVARNMKYLNFLICAGGENFDCFQTIGDKTHQPNPTVDIRLPYWKVGPNPFPKQHDFRPWGTVAGANGLAVRLALSLGVPRAAAQRARRENRDVFLKLPTCCGIFQNLGISSRVFLRKLWGWQPQSVQVLYPDKHLLPLLYEARVLVNFWVWSSAGILIKSDFIPEGVWSNDSNLIKEHH